MGKAKWPSMALRNIVSRLFLRSILIGSKINWPIILDIYLISFVL